MGKGDRARKKALPSIAPIPKRKAQGKKRMRQIGDEIDTEQTNLKARAVRLGIRPTDEALRAMRDPNLDSEAGLAIHIATQGEERRQLNEIARQWRKCHARFLGNVINRSLWSGRDSVPHIPEPFETRDDSEIDLRSEDEKADAARRAWQAFCIDLGILTEAQIRICHRGVWDVQPVNFVRNARLTYDGQVFVQSLKRLNEYASG